MTSRASTLWIPLQPPLRSRQSKAMFTELGKALARAGKVLELDARVERYESVRRQFAGDVAASRYQDSQALLACGLVLADLAVQGWPLRVARGSVQVHPPLKSEGGHLEEKTRIRQQELVKRDSQLRQPSVAAFVSGMERTRMHRGRFVSIFSLMRDGRELAGELREAKSLEGLERTRRLDSAVSPYLQFVDSGDRTCEFTGFRLMDIWRYFRHTWSNQYMSVPGRSMLFLVRDRAAANHPVMGLCALSSPIMQIRERDSWIGWTPEAFIARIQRRPTAKLADWLQASLDDAIAQIFVDDLVEDGLLTARELRHPTASTVERLGAEAARRRKMHHRFVQRSEHRGKRESVVTDTHWEERARTHLFRSKRALSLATLLKARATLRVEMVGASKRASLANLAQSRSGQEAIRVVLRKAKADRVGICVADISVCGAIQPYNAILGGKLAAMLAASPEVVGEYHARYKSAESEIASSMAGRSVVRSPRLVLLGTTSLYGIGSSQYNRIRIPCERIGGQSNDEIKYEELGHSESFGTSQYSEETVSALTDYVQQSESGQRVNSIFGEGISPKLRKVRQGLDLLNLPSSLLLQHHRHRIVYGVSLISNLTDYLIGIDAKPRYKFPLRSGVESSAGIAEWWRDRWLFRRIESDAVLEEVQRHAMVLPVRHGARVSRPTLGLQPGLFPD